MTTLTLNISEELLAALNLAGRERQVSEDQVAVELLEGALLPDGTASRSDRWIEAWSGRLKGREDAASNDPRVQHLLAKHLR